MADVARELLKVLASLGKSSRFFASGGLAPELPGLEVERIGQVGIPVTAADAKRLIKQASQAPYGRGEETIVDTGVRRVWQIEPGRFSLQNAQWEPFLGGIIDSVRREFGIGQKVEPKLYKLLIYEKGSFFAPHRDTEKTPGMFATLVVCLPSRHQGGTLVVGHAGQTAQIDFAGSAAEYRIQYAAFYADCRHEVKPITQGYRICLVYNLAIARSKQQPSAPRDGPVVEKVAEVLPRWFADRSNGRDRIVVPLAHQYTEAGLDPRELKGADRSRADVLFRAADQLGFQAFLALMTHSQHGSVDCDSWHGRPYRSRRWSDSDDEEVDDRGKNSSARMGEVYNEKLSLDHWLDARGRKQPFGEMHIKEHEILGRAKDRKYQQTVSEATGNEGATLERWYRGGVVVLWPRDRYFSILAREGQATAIPALEKLIAGTAKPAADEPVRRFAEEIIGHWQPGRYHRRDQASQSARMLKLLARIGSPELAGRFIREILPGDHDGTEGDALGRLCGRLGWSPFAAALADFFAKQGPLGQSQLGRLVSIFDDFCASGTTAKDGQRRSVCASLAGEVEQLVSRWDGYQGHDWSRMEEDRAGIPERVIHAFSVLSETERLDRFASHVIQEKQRYDLHLVLIPAVQAIAKWIKDEPAGRDAFGRLLNHSLAELRALTATPIVPPGDWSREVDLDCKCPDCSELSRFLRDPIEAVHRFPVRKDRREHLHGQIERHNLDLARFTDRKGSPQTLVCTKTQASYERRRSQFSADKQFIAELDAQA